MRATVCCYPKVHKTSEYNSVSQIQQYLSLVEGFSAILELKEYVKIVSNWSLFYAHTIQNFPLSTMSKVKVHELQVSFWTLHYTLAVSVIFFCFITTDTLDIILIIPIVIVQVKIYSSTIQQVQWYKCETHNDKNNKYTLIQIWSSIFMVPKYVFCISWVVIADDANSIRKLLSSALPSQSTWNMYLGAIEMLHNIVGQF